MCVDGTPGSCVSCWSDTCTSQLHPVFNPVAPYQILLPTGVYLSDLD